MDSHQMNCCKTAWDWMQQSPLIVDTETTGIEPDGKGPHEMIEVAVAGADGLVLLHTLSASHAIHLGRCWAPPRQHKNPPLDAPCLQGGGRRSRR